MTPSAPAPNPRDLVAQYFAMGLPPIFWPQIGDEKGPRRDGWQHERPTLADYHEGNRVGLFTGYEVTPGKFLIDTDIDWAPGAPIAQKLLLPSGFVFGRASKPVSHCFNLLPEALRSFRYEDPIDNTCLLELRGTKQDGTIGLQTMSPPSIWTKNGQREPLEFYRFEELRFHADVARFTHCHNLTAIGMLLAKHLGHNGFGHEARLCWAGFLLRAGVSPDDLILMGEGMSAPCNNLEVTDVRRVVESTATALAADRKVKGGPALAKLLGKDGKKVIARIDEWLGRGQDFIRDAKGNVIAKNQHNIRRAIELLGHELSYNEFAFKLLLDGKPIEDPQWMSLYLEIDSEHHFQPPVEYFKMVIQDIAAKNGFHPVKQYLDALAWDGKPRIDTWLIRCAGVEDSPYVRAISSIMLIAAVRRIRQPGCKYDEMVVFESPQGWNKSTALRALCPDDAWFSDDLRLNLHAQQLIEATLGKWIIEASELSGRRKAEIEQLKAMLSRQSDGPARMAYGHFPVERARHFIIIGTTNSSAYLTDSTGARRFWPIEVQRFDIALIKKHRDQMWAEACVREAKGESIRLPEELWPAAAEQQERRHEIDPWETVLRAHIDDASLVAPRGDGKRRVTAEALFDALGIEVARRDRTGQLRVSQVMQRLGFKNGSVWDAEQEKSVPGYVEKGASGLRIEHEEQHE